MPDFPRNKKKATFGVQASCLRSLQIQNGFPPKRKQAVIVFSSFLDYYQRFTQMNHMAVLTHSYDSRTSTMLCVKGLRPPSQHWSDAMYGAGEAPFTPYLRKGASFILAWISLPPLFFCMCQNHGIGRGQTNARCSLTFPSAKKHVIFSLLSVGI